MKNPSSSISAESQSSPVRIDSVAVFEQIYREHWSLLFDIAYKRIKSVEKSEELVQELFTSLWEKRASIEIRESIQGYLVQSMKQRVLNQMRNEMVRQKHLSRIRYELPQSMDTTEQAVALSDLQASFEKEVRNLPGKCQEVFLLSRQQNLSLKEIAERLNISANTVEKHIVKALKILRYHLRDFVSIFVLWFVD